MPFAETKDGVKLHYALHDFTDPWRKAETIILQHGFSRSSRFWFAMVPYLSRFYRVVCPDLRGLGQSSKPRDLKKDITVENYVSDIVQIADAVGARTFHYAGESLGGMLGMVLAAKHPDRVRTLGLLSSSLTIRQDSQKAFAGNFPTWQDALRTLGSKGWSAAQNAGFRFPPGTDSALLDWYRDECAVADVNVLIAMSELAVTVDTTPFLEQIKAPVLGLYPTGGAFAKSGQEEILRSRIANIRLIHFPMQHHMVWVLAPATCADHLLHFMSEQDGTVCREP